MRLGRRLAATAAAAAIGYVVVGVVVGLIWVVLFLDESAGSGNSRESYGWFAVGGLLGVVLFAGLAWRWTGQQREPASR